MKIDNPKNKNKETEESVEEELSIILNEGLTPLGGNNKVYSNLIAFLEKKSMLSRPKRLLNGQLLFFKYIPTDEKFLERKTKNYYDIFPLIFVTETHRGGFQGINLQFKSRYENYVI